MYSLILKIATRYLLPLLLVFSIFLLLRGHNDPGGGFVGGLIATCAFALHLMADGAHDTQRVVRVDSKLYIAAGLALAGLSGVWSLFSGRPFLTSQWGDQPIPVMGKLGTPLLFDVGVYLVVLGTVLTILLSLAVD